MYKKIVDEIKSFSSPEGAKRRASFFKTGRGEYAEGDLFLGVDSPSLRKIAKKYFKAVSYADLQKMLESPYHEIRVGAVFILVLMFQHGSEEERKKIFDFYMENIRYINNWDLVDVSAPYIVGPVAFENESVLFLLAKSCRLWEERVSVVATLYFIKQNRFDVTLSLGEYFLTHRHDLMHKAVGWMLREVGKRDEKVLCDFLDKHINQMPRTMLRYAIERFPEDKRRRYLLK
ncbi:MAG TPA: DNA alkylation repair protein [Candidatus Adamsella sp.]|nr:DNA alkylation repair protein [Candidatus Adamsella sp.]